MGGAKWGEQNGGGGQNEIFLLPNMAGCFEWNVMLQKPNRFCSSELFRKIRFGGPGKESDSKYGFDSY